MGCRTKSSSELLIDFTRYVQRGGRGGPVEVVEPAEAEISIASLKTELNESQFLAFKELWASCSAAELASRPKANIRKFRSEHPKLSKDLYSEISKWISFSLDAPVQKAIKALTNLDDSVARELSMGFVLLLVKIESLAPLERKGPSWPVQIAAEMVRILSDPEEALGFKITKERALGVAVEWSQQQLGHPLEEETISSEMKKAKKKKRNFSLDSPTGLFSFEE